MRSLERCAFACFALLALTSCSAHERRGLTLGSSCNQDFQCDDAHVCNGVERCLAGTCALGATPDCDDGDACTRDGCSEGLGCVHVTRDAPMCRASEPAIDAGSDASQQSMDAGAADAELPQQDASAPERDAGEPAIVDPLDPAHPPEVTCNSAVPMLNVASQEALERYDGVECVTGALTVNGEITSLEPLRNLRWVGGAASFTNISTAQLEDLSRLVRVDGDLDFHSDGNLYWLQGLESLRFVGGSFHLYESYTPEPRSWPAINVVTGPPKLRNVGGDLSASAGTRIEGFEALERVGGSVGVSAPELLGFDALTSIEGSLSVHGFGGTELRSFAALTHVGSSFVVQVSPFLESLAGFAALEHVGGLVDIRGNARLEVLPPKLGYFRQLDVRLNPRLSRCAIEALVERARANGSGVEPVTCCNRGCDSCVAGGCAVPGAISSGQSTHYEGAINYYDNFPLQALTAMTRVTQLDITVWPLFNEPTVFLPLETVDQELYLRNANSDDLLLLTQLESVGGLGIYEGWMESLAGLEGLRAINGYLDIYGNYQLTDLSALDPARGSSLEVMELSYMQIYENPVLPQCEAQALRDASLARGTSPLTSFYVSGGVPCEGTCEGLMCVPPPEPEDAGVSDAGDAGDAGD